MDSQRPLELGWKGTLQRAQKARLPGAWAGPAEEGLSGKPASSLPVTGSPSTAVQTQPLHSWVQSQPDRLIPPCLFLVSGQ